MLAAKGMTVSPPQRVSSPRHQVANAILAELLEVAQPPIRQHARGPGVLEARKLRPAAVGGIGVTAAGEHQHRTRRRFGDRLMEQGAEPKLGSAGGREIGDRGDWSEQPPRRGADQAENVGAVAVKLTHGFYQGRARDAVEHVVGQSRQPGGHGRGLIAVSRAAPGRPRAPADPPAELGGPLVSGLQELR
jgi:hypothetical protein